MAFESITTLRDIYVPEAADPTIQDMVVVRLERDLPDPPTLKAWWKLLWTHWTSESVGITFSVREFAWELMQEDPLSQMCRSIAERLAQLILRRKSIKDVKVIGISSCFGNTGSRLTVTLDIKTKTLR